MFLNLNYQGQLILQKWEFFSLHQIKSFCKTTCHQHSKTIFTFLQVKVQLEIKSMKQIFWLVGSNLLWVLKKKKDFSITIKRSNLHQLGNPKIHRTCLCFHPSKLSLIRVTLNRDLTLKRKVILSIIRQVEGLIATIHLHKWNSITNWTINL